MRRLLESEKLRFLAAGVWNTAVGYLAFVAFYLLFGGTLHYVVVLGLAYVVSITNAFLTLKLFVFRSRAPWLPEYLRTYVSYLSVAVLNAAVLATLVELTPLGPIPAQAIAMAFAVLASYLAHKYFTFRLHRQPADG